MNALTEDTVICHLKAVRTQKKMTQTQLAEEVGIKRQAIYDIESGRYLPNTGVALKLARCLGCRIEDLFQEVLCGQYQPATLVSDKELLAGTRVTLAKINGRLIAYPLDRDIPARHGIEPADALLSSCGKQVKLLHDEAALEKRVLLMGCDPAFSLLTSHVSQTPGESQVNWQFASTYRALERLSSGHTHIAGIHLHNTGSDESNAELARKMLKGSKGRLVGFSLFEEGLMVAPGNPLNIRVISDLTKKEITMVNREKGAALRVLLDDCLERENIPSNLVRGYEDLVKSHSEGAHRVVFRTADAALGMRAVAASFGLDFVPVTAVRSDLVIPEEFFDHPSVQVLLDVLQTRAFRDELASLAGYDASFTGKVIAQI